jgi:hypothetical protein
MSVPARYQLLAVLAVALVCSTPAGLAFAGPRLFVERSPTGVRLSASAAPLPAVFAELRRVAHVSVEGLQHVTAVVTAEFDLPLDVALRRLMRGYSFVLTESSGGVILRILGRSTSMTSGDEDDIRHRSDTETPPETLHSAGNVERLTRLISEGALHGLEAPVSADLDTRLEALSALAQIGQEALGIVTTAVEDPDPAVRQAAVRFLAGAGTEAVRQLLTVFREVNDAELRLMVLSAVVAHGDSASADILAVARQDRDPAVRARAQLLSSNASVNPSHSR